MLPKPQSCLSVALLVFLDVTVNLECLEQKTSPLSSESGLFTVFPFSDNAILVGTNCTRELASGLLTLLDILNLWRQVLWVFFKEHSVKQMCILGRKLESISAEGPFVSGKIWDCKVPRMPAIILGVDFDQRKFPNPSASWLVT